VWSGTRRHRSARQAIEGPFAPEEFKDVYREELEAMIAKKVEQAEVTPASQRSVEATPVVDIMEALKKSIAMARKPAASETPARKTRGRATEMETKGKRASRKAH
jgi:DNA end-binding protein Ku